MAINEIGMKPKKEENGWDKISKVMGFASTAMGVAGGISDLAGKAPAQAANPLASAAPSTPIIPDPMQGNAMYRRFMSGQRTG